MEFDNQSKTLKDMFLTHRICAIMRAVPLDVTIDYAKAVINGGIKMIEVAVNSEFAYRQIEMLADKFGDKVLIGAGSVVNMTGCQNAKAAGAQFFLTPSATIVTMDFCKKNGIPLLPGVMTPTDVELCISYGYNTLKLFPAGDLPDKYINSLKGPFNNTDFVAVGGVNAENINKFLSAGFIGVGIGSSLIPKNYLTSGQWDEATDYIRNIVDKVHAH